MKCQFFKLPQISTANGHQRGISSHTTPNGTIDPMFAGSDVHFGTRNLRFILSPRINNSCCKYRPLQHPIEIMQFSHDVSPPTSNPRDIPRVHLGNHSCPGIFHRWIHPLDSLPLCPKNRGACGIVLEYWNHGCHIVGIWVSEDGYYTWVVWKGERNRKRERRFSDAFRWDDCGRSSHSSGENNRLRSSDRWSHHRVRLNTNFITVF